METRAGRYIKQPQGYRAFIPEGLPPIPPLQIDQEMWSLLSKADRALGRLDGSTEILPNPELFVFMYVHREAVLSSQIEGTQASLMDVLRFEAEALEPGRPKDVEEVVNYVAAMNYGLSRLKELPVSLRLIREIHEKLMKGVRGGERNPGEFRSSQNWIGPPGGSLREASYVPPPPAEMMDSLDNFEKFLHSTEPMPVLITVGLSHAQFETIHPFLDGNGRVGRLLITFLLCEKGILKRPLLYLSYYFKQHRSEYYDRLQAIRDKGAWEQWINFFLQGISEVSAEASEKAKQIVNLRESHRHMISEKMGGKSGKGLALLESLYWRPIVTVNHVVEVTGLSYSNANRLIETFTAEGLLEEITGWRRNRRFSYHPYLNLFVEEKQ